jgi:hypothetical protein
MSTDGSGACSLRFGAYFGRAYPYPVGGRMSELALATGAVRRRAGPAFSNASRSPRRGRLLHIFVVIIGCWLLRESRFRDNLAPPSARVHCEALDVATRCTSMRPARGSQSRRLGTGRHRRSSRPRRQPLYGLAVQAGRRHRASSASHGPRAPPEVQRQGMAALQALLVVVRGDGKC